MASFAASGERTLDPADQLDELLNAHQLSREEVAQALGCDVSTIYARQGRARARRKGKAARRSRRTALDGRIDSLLYLLTELAVAGVPEKTVHRWLFCRSAHLRGRSPAEVLAAGRFELARAAAFALRRGWSPERFRHEFPDVDGLLPEPGRPAHDEGVSSLVEKRRLVG